MEIKDQVCAIRDEETSRAVQTLGFQSIEFGEERRDMYDNSVSDDSSALWVDETCYGVSL